MSTLVFDIETVGEDWEALDPVTQSSLSRWINQTAKNLEEHSVLLANLKAGLGFSPFTGFVVAVGIYDVERGKGVVYYSGHGNEADETVGVYTYKERSEEAMLAEFWDGARHYDTFVTYNGRGFDVPFLVHRSLSHNIMPTKDLLEGRYPYQQKSCRHVDLQDELSFFGALRRAPSLHLLCRAYGIESPKGEVGGDDVAKLFASKKFRDIALYNSRDVTATHELYKVWQEYKKNLTSDLEIDF